MSNPVGWVLRIGLVAIAACHSERNIDPREPLRLDREHGVVVGSVNAPAVDHYHKRVTFRLRQVEGKRTEGLDAGVPRPVAALLESAPDPGLEETNGRLFARELPAGDYEVHEVWIHVGASPIVIRPSAPPRFRVRAGEVAYLGAFHMAFRVAPVSSVRSAIRGGTPSFRDESARDLPLLRARFPILAQHEIVPRVIDAAGTTWARK